ncbi:MAG: NUDIX domain-containing protein [Chlamydiales bacterium]|nr:NUDIX domain-containing protein [Chlamydiales bacterium]NCF70585.1 NUDIX domain-containing protein [Chlamydiales bacterium]
MQKKRPLVGIGVLVYHDKQLLLSKRIASHGAHHWSPAGGHLEFAESPEEGAKRELKEETGLIAKNLIVGPWTNDFFIGEDKHYISLFILVDEFEGQLENKEPHKSLDWQWFDIDKLPSPLFLPLENLIKMKKMHPLLKLAKKKPSSCLLT